MIAGAVGLTLFGMYRFLGDVEERKWVASVCLSVSFILFCSNAREGRAFEETSFPHNLRDVVLAWSPVCLLFTCPFQQQPSPPPLSLPHSPFYPHPQLHVLGAIQRKVPKGVR